MFSKKSQFRRTYYTHTMLHWTLKIIYTFPKYPIFCRITIQPCFHMWTDLTSYCQHHVISIDCWTESHILVKKQTRKASGTKRTESKTQIWWCQNKMQHSDCLREDKTKQNEVMLSSAYLSCLPRFTVKRMHSIQRQVAGMQGRRHMYNGSCGKQMNGQLLPLMENPSQEASLDS